MAPTKRHRFQAPRKDRAKEGKKRKPYAKEQKPRKKYDISQPALAARGDIKGLALQRKLVSKKKLSRRLKELSFKQLGAYAKQAGRISIRTAQRDRGQKLHEGRLNNEEKAELIDRWKFLLSNYAGTDDYHHLCTHQALIDFMLEEHDVRVSKYQCSRILGKTKIRKPSAKVKIRVHQIEFVGAKKNSQNV